MDEDVLASLPADGPLPLQVIAAPDDDHAPAAAAPAAGPAPDDDQAIIAQVDGLRRGMFQAPAAVLGVQQLDNMAGAAVGNLVGAAPPAIDLGAPGNPLHMPTGGAPVMELGLSGLYTCMFPSLFVMGGDLTVQDGELPPECDGHRLPSEAEMTQFLLRWSVRLPDGSTMFPFQAHPRWLFYMVTQKFRKQGLALAHVVIKTRPEDFGGRHGIASVAELADRMSDTTWRETFARRCCGYTTATVGSPAYWAEAGRKLSSMMEFHGPPSIFFTVSCADMQAWELHNKLFANTQSKFRNVVDNPVLVAEWFVQRVHAWIDTLRKSTMGITHTFVRYVDLCRHAHLLSKACLTSW
jgi:hypothetical protein